MPHGGKEGGRREEEEGHPGESVSLADIPRLPRDSADTQIAPSGTSSEPDSAQTLASSASYIISMHFIVF